MTAPLLKALTTIATTSRLEQLAKSRSAIATTNERRRSTVPLPGPRTQNQVPRPHLVVQPRSLEGTLPSNPEEEAGETLLQR